MSKQTPQKSQEPSIEEQMERFRQAVNAAAPRTPKLHPRHYTNLVKKGKISKSKLAKLLDAKNIAYDELLKKFEDRNTSNPNKLKAPWKNLLTATILYTIATTILTCVVVYGFYLLNR